MDKFNKNWYKNIKKSPLTPPNYTFGIVWPILYMLILGSFIVFVSSDVPKEKKYIPLLLFFIQLVANLIWTTLFFRYKLIKWAFFDLIIIVVFTFLTILAFYKLNKLSAYLLIPYLLWISFALYLNYYIVIEN